LEKTNPLWALLRTASLSSFTTEIPASRKGTHFLCGQFNERDGANLRTDLTDPALESKPQEYIHATGLVATCHHPAHRLRESPDI